MTQSDTYTLLLGILRSRAEPAGWSWFERARPATTEPVDTDRLLTVYAGATWRLGRTSVGALPLDEAEQHAASRLPDSLPLDHWGLDEVGRVLLLLSLAEAVSNDTRFVELARACYTNGAAREQQSWVRGLILLPRCERFLEAAVDACRTNIVPLFESLACENPFPSRHFPEPGFNQLVLKSLFNDIALSRIMRLETRLNCELSRMANDYVSEREAAGRSVPADIWLVVAPHVEGVGPAALDRVHRYLRGDDRNHRYWAAVGLGHAAPAASRPELERQRRVEADARVNTALDAALAVRGESPALHRDR